MSPALCVAETNLKERTEIGRLAPSANAWSAPGWRITTSRSAGGKLRSSCISLKQGRSQPGGRDRLFAMPAADSVMIDLTSRT